MITVTDLEKRYGDLVAVSGVSFEVEPGEIVGLLGHNGAGKTTIMKILTGFLEPTSGSLSVGGHDVAAERLEVQELIGYMPENAPLYPEMLVQEYLLMMAELRGIPEAERVARVVEVATSTGLRERLVQPIGTLSKGYRQRVSLAQAILHRPKVLVLDEPTNGLDPVQILEIRELIHALSQQATILLSTHILQEIEAVCDRVLVLIDGHLTADERLEDMLRSDVVHLTLRGEAEGVQETLAGIDGVESVELAEATDETVRYRLRCREDARPTSEVVRVAVERGWTVEEVDPERPNLERVFRDLMAEHVSRMCGEEAEA